MGQRRGDVVSASHKAEELKGRIKEAIGALTDNDRLRSEGRSDQASAALKRNANKATDKVKNATRSARKKLTRG